jgi:hypothetical protein
MSDRDPNCGQGGFDYEGVKYQALLYSDLTLQHFIR